jgi:hypothetical protein
MSELDELAQMVASRASGLALYARQWLDAASAEGNLADRALDYGRSLL